MSDSFTISSFKYGVDTRKSELTSNPGTLVLGENGFIDAGGLFNKRLAFPLKYVLGILDSLSDTGTFGLQETDSGLMTFGSALPNGATVTFNQPTLASAIPAGTVYQQLMHPEVADLVNGFQSGFNYDRTKHRMTKVVNSVASVGKPFVAATFADGRTYLYYNGILIDSSRNGIVMPNGTSLAALGKDLARQINALNGWLSTKNGDTYAGAASAVPSVALTGSGAGATFTTTMANGVITAATVGAAGSGYAVGDVLLVQDSTGTGATVKVATLAGSGVATVTVVYGGLATINGLDVVESPPGADFAVTQTLTSALGLFGVLLLDQNNPGIGASCASATFQITGNGGSNANTITVKAPQTASAQNPEVTLANAIVWNTGGNAATAAAVVAAINASTFLYGYTATSDSAGNVVVCAPPSFGAFTLNLDVSGTIATGAGSTLFSLTLTPPNLNVSVANTGGTTIVKGTIVASTANGTSPISFLWSEATPGSGNGIRMQSTSGSTNLFYKALDVGVSVTGTFYCKATDSSGTPKQIIRYFSVTLMQRTGSSH